MFLSLDFFSSVINIFFYNQLESLKVFCHNCSLRRERSCKKCALWTAMDKRAPLLTTKVEFWYIGYHKCTRDLQLSKQLPFLVQKHKTPGNTQVIASLPFPGLEGTWTNGSCTVSNQVNMNGEEENINSLTWENVETPCNFYFWNPVLMCP